MKKREIRKSLIDFLMDNARRYVISAIIRQDLNEYKSEYMKLHNSGLPPDLDARFMDWEKGKAAKEANDIIETCVDEFIASKFRWLPFRNIAVTGLLVVPAISSRILYGIRHFSFIIGHEDAFAGLGYGELAMALFSLLGLSSILVASCVDELRKE